MAARARVDLLEVRLDLPAGPAPSAPPRQPSTEAAVTARVQEASRRRLARAMERLRERAAAGPPA